MQAEVHRFPQALSAGASSLNRARMARPNSWPCAWHWG
jgi:hypothetical protein